MAQPPNPNRPDAPGNQPQGERLEVPQRLIDALRQSRRSKLEPGQVRVWVEGPDGTTSTKVYSVPLTEDDLIAIGTECNVQHDASVDAELERLAAVKAQADARMAALQAKKAARG